MEPVMSLMLELPSVRALMMSPAFPASRLVATMEEPATAAPTAVLSWTVGAAKAVKARVAREKKVAFILMDVKKMFFDEEQEQKDELEGGSASIYPFSSFYGAARKLSTAIVPGHVQSGLADANLSRIRALSWK